MKEQEWVSDSLDKKSWGEGPWVDEPDKIQWQDPDTGLPCLIVRGPLGALCGYVGVGPDHPWYGLRPHECPAGDLDVHGGVNFASKCIEPEEGELTICHVVEDGEEDDVWWFGFDCGHFNDITPRMDADRRKYGGPPLDQHPEPFRRWYRDRVYVQEQVTMLAMQIFACNPPTQGETA